MRGINIPSLICPISKASVEDSNHAIVSCAFASRVWEAIAKWWNLSHIFLWEVSELSSPDIINKVESNVRRVWEAVIIVSVWAI